MFKEMAEEKIYLSQADYSAISTLLENTSDHIADALWQEFDRAIVVDNQKLPADIVAMNSIVEFLDLDTRQKSRIQLVYPQHANIREGRISILAPVGAALIGLAVGQSIDWPLEPGQSGNPLNKKSRKLRVISVLHQE